MTSVDSGTGGPPRRSAAEVHITSSPSRWRYFRRKTRFPSRCMSRVDRPPADTSLSVANRVSPGINLSPSAWCPVAGPRVHSGVPSLSMITTLPPGTFGSLGSASSTQSLDFLVAVFDAHAPVLSGLCNTRLPSSCIHSSAPGWPCAVQRTVLLLTWTRSRFPVPRIMSWFAPPTNDWPGFNTPSDASSPITGDSASSHRKSPGGKRVITAWQGLCLQGQRLPDALAFDPVDPIRTSSEMLDAMTLFIPA